LEKGTSLRSRFLPRVFYVFFVNWGTSLKSFDNLFFFLWCVWGALSVSSNYDTPKIFRLRRVRIFFGGLLPPPPRKKISLSANTINKKKLWRFFLYLAHSCTFQCLVFIDKYNLFIDKRFKILYAIIFWQISQNLQELNNKYSKN
jgi:hypothetical protein